MLKLFVIAIRLAMPLMLTAAILLSSRGFAPRSRKMVTRVTVLVFSAGLLAAAVLAWLRLNTQLIDIPTLNAWLGPPTFLLVTLFLVAIWTLGGRNLHDVNQTWRHRFVTVTAWAALLSSSAFFGFPYFFGTDGIVLMGSSFFETESLQRFAGFILGSALVVVACWGYVVSAKRVPWQLRALVATVVLGALVVPRMLLFYQQLATRRFVPQSSAVFQSVLWVQNNQAIMYLALGVVICIPALVAVLSGNYPIAKNPAEVRINRAERTSRRQFLALAASSSVAFALALTVGKARAEYVPELSAIEPSEVVGPELLVARELVDDGHLHRFAYQASDGVEVRFIVIKKNDVAFGCGLDACEICGPSGYYEDKGRVICKRCDVMMNIQTIGFPGGCNPIPITHEVREKHLAFQVAELEEMAKVFR